MRLGHAIWRSPPEPLGPPRAAEAARRLPECSPDFRRAAEELGILPRLVRKPWVILGDARQDLEAAFGLATDSLLIALGRWLQAAAGAPAAVGLAHVSGNVYLGPALAVGPATLSPEQTLVANLYSHGEIGLDAVCAPGLPTPGPAALLRELATFRRLRWLDLEACLPGAEADRAAIGGAPPRREPGSIVKPARQSLFKKHPLLAGLLEPDGSAADAELPGAGNCLQHPNFAHLDIVGDGLGELQASLARNSAARAYCPAGGSGQAACLADLELDLDPALDLDLDLLDLVGLVSPCSSTFLSLRTSSSISTRRWTSTSTCWTWLAGCAVRTRAGALYAGFALGTRCGLGGLSPLQSALVSLGANGAQASDITSVLWTAHGSPPEGALARLRLEDEALLRAVAPEAHFEDVQRSE